MVETSYRGRRAASIENRHVRLTVLTIGGHIAEIVDKESGINPLWTPPWDSMEPTPFDAAKHPEYGAGAEARLLAGIMGHNLCLDVFGGPSPEEAAAGLAVHGEGSIVPYEIGESDGGITMRARLPMAGLDFQRDLRLDGRVLHIRETVTNAGATDRPIAWTQHVTLGPPFLERGATRFRLSATRSKVYEEDFGVGGYLERAAEFEWPMAPRLSGGWADLTVFNSDPVSSAFTTHLMDPERDDAFFIAFAPNPGLAFAYTWRREDFPWTGIWEENHSRSFPPWNGRTLACGMEFGASPIPESRRAMIDRGRLFGVPAYRWLPARGSLTVEYRATVFPADALPETPESS